MKAKLLMILLMVLFVPASKAAVERAKRRPILVKRIHNKKLNTRYSYRNIELLGTKLPANFIPAFTSKSGNSRDRWEDSIL